MTENNLGGWDCISAPDGRVHVVPRQDLKPHACAPGCWCRPTGDDDVLVHNSLDRREFAENRKLA